MKAASSAGAKVVQILQGTFQLHTILGLSFQSSLSCAFIVIPAPLWPTLNTSPFRRSSEAIKKQQQCQEGTISVLDRAYSEETGTAGQAWRAQIS